MPENLPDIESLNSIYPHLTTNANIITLKWSKYIVAEVSAGNLKLPIPITKKIERGNPTPEDITEVKGKVEKIYGYINKIGKEILLANSQSMLEGLIKGTSVYSEWFHSGAAIHLSKKNSPISSQKEELLWNKEFLDLFWFSTKQDESWNYKEANILRQNFKEIPEWKAMIWVFLDWLKQITPSISESLIKWNMASSNSPSYTASKKPPITTAKK